MKFFYTIFLLLIAGIGYCQTSWSTAKKVGTSKAMTCNLKYPVNENEKITVQALHAIIAGDKASIDPSQVILRLHFRNRDEYYDSSLDPTKIETTSEGIYIYNVGISVDGMNVNEIEFIVKVKQRNALNMEISGSVIK